MERVGAGAQPLVLVVDDDASVRHALERALRLEGFAVATAAGGRGRGLGADLELGALVAVSIRTEESRRLPGNRLGGMIVPLPVGVTDPIARLERAARSALIEMSGFASLMLNHAYSALCLPLKLALRGLPVRISPGQMVVT